MSKARKKAEKPEFMNQVTLEALCGVWRLPSFVAKSERGKTARQSNKRLHTDGSIPISEHKKKLREELSREPSVSELFLRCHQNKKTKVFVDATAKAAWSKSSEHCAQTEFIQTEFPQSYTKSSEPFRALAGDE
nr:1,3-beta-glucan synthase subunit FKS1-like, domain-1 [Tanacetum cinerariifolium]